MSIVLDVTVRDNTGTGPARAARRENVVPGVLYGGGEDSIAIGMKFNEVLKAINSGSFLANMVEISHDGKTQKVLTKDVQFHPVTDRPVHIDFYRVKENTIIEVEVSVNLIGEDENVALKGEGSLNLVRHSIEVKCPAGSIPDQIDVDVTNMEIGDSLHISEVTLPAKVKPSITDRDFTIVTMVQSRVEAEEDLDAEVVDAGDVPATAQTDEEEQAEGGED